MAYFGLYMHCYVYNLSVLPRYSVLLPHNSPRPTSARSKAYTVAQNKIMHSLVYSSHYVSVHYSTLCLVMYLAIPIHCYSYLALIYCLDGLAVDWVNEELYFTDKSLNIIGKYDLVGPNYTVLIRTGANTRPRAIVLDPNARLVFMVANTYVIIIAKGMLCLSSCVVHGYYSKLVRSYIATHNCRVFGCLFTSLLTHKHMWHYAGSRV